ncbi:MAG: hypothetical protein II983_03785 [Firmicutes bacterium]|nr:hypothetical protein [Bacillota bacterium]
MKNEYNPNMIHQAKIYRSYSNVNVREDKSLFNELVTMADRVKELPYDSREIAERIMDQVEAYEANWEHVSDTRKISGNVNSIINGMFDKISSLEPEQRIDIMQQMLRGFTVFTEGEESRESTDPVGCMADMERTLQNQLKTKIHHLRISPAGLKRMKKSLLKDENYVATAAALRNDGYALKCIVAMDMYLTEIKNFEDNIPEKAALNACMYVDLEAIADGARVGGCFETVASVLVIVLLITVCICAIDLLLKAKTISDIVLITLSGLGLIELTDKMGDVLIRQIGHLAVIGTHLIKKGVETVVEGFDTMMEKAKEAQEEDYIVEEEEGGVFWDETTDRIYVY